MSDRLTSQQMICGTLMKMAMVMILTVLNMLVFMIPLRIMIHDTGDHIHQQKTALIVGKSVCSRTPEMKITELVVQMI